MNQGVPRSVTAARRVVHDRITIPARTLNLTERVNSTRQTIFVHRSRQGNIESAYHRRAGDTRVDGQQGIVKQDKVLESGSLADCVRLVASSAIDLVQRKGANDVGSSEDER